MQGLCCRPCLLLPGSNAGSAVHPSIQISMDGILGAKGMLNNSSACGFVVQHPPCPGQTVYPALARDLFSHVTSTVPRGEGTFLHTASYKVKATCSTSLQEFRKMSTHLNHEHHAQTFHSGLTKFWHQNGHQLLLLLPGVQHQGPPMDPSPPSATLRQCLALRIPNSVLTCTWGKRQSK